MCGIAGFQGWFDSALLDTMANALVHRGPDDSGVWYSAESRTGLAHRRLSIIDLSPTGHQPMVDQKGKAVIVFNGEIYNFRELRADLESHGHQFLGHSDTEVLLNLYLRYGEAMLPMLNGIFAFAVFDMSRHTLFLACDEMGVKPLYFHQSQWGTLFASELKALAVYAGLPREVNVPALFRYLGFLWSPGGMTPLKGVHRLGPGEALLVEEGRLTRRWQWSPSAWPITTLPVQDEEAIDRVRTAVRTAVRRQMVADVPVGAFLSGGVDSSTMVAMAREVSPTIECFTIDLGGIQDPGINDDLAYARHVAKHFGVRLHEVQVDSSHMTDHLVAMVHQLDEPLADPAPLSVWFISQLARQHGVKVLLSGTAGDYLFTGYRRHQALMLERYWSWMPKNRPVGAASRDFDNGGAG